MDTESKPRIRSVDPYASSQTLRGTFEAYQDMSPDGRADLDALLERMETKAKKLAAERVASRARPGFGPINALELLGALLVFCDKCAALKRGHPDKDLDPERYPATCRKCQLTAVCTHPGSGNGNGKNGNGGNGGKP